MDSYFKNSNTLAHAVKEIASMSFTPRPFNRFKPDDTTWWLVSTTEWPAYKYGKIFFDSDLDRIPSSKDGIYSGFYIEKGLSPKVKDLYHSSLIMGDDWLWDEFINVLLGDSLSLPVDQILTIVVSYIPPEKASLLESPEGFLDQKAGFEGSRVSFEVKTDLNIRVIDKKLNPVNNDISDYFKQEIITANNLSELVSRLSGIPQVDWIWLDFYIGTIMSKNSEKITPGKLWKKHLEFWSPWLRKG